MGHSRNFMGAISRRVRLTQLCLAIAWTPLSAFAQLDASASGENVSALLPPSRLVLGASKSLHINNASAEEPAPAPWYDDVGVRTKIFLTASVLGVATYGALKWWNTGLSTDFRTQSEGWFGRNTPKGGADKLGHAFGTYTGVRAGAHVLELLGNSHDDALRIATIASLAAYTGVEILDGFTKPYRFSKEDVIANVVGAGLGWVMQTNPKLDALVDFRLYYRQSPEAKAEGKWEPFDDYNGQKYLLAFKGSGVPAFATNPVLRYTEVVVGYGVRGYDPPNTARSRHLYAGVALNVAQLLDDTVFRHRADSVLRKETGLFLELFQLPGTVLLANRRL